jgi:hypothetical protein
VVVEREKTLKSSCCRYAESFISRDFFGFDFLSEIPNGSNLHLCNIYSCQVYQGGIYYAKLEILMRVLGGGLHALSRLDISQEFIGRVGVLSGLKSVQA